MKIQKSQRFWCFAEIFVVAFSETISVMLLNSHESWWSWIMMVQSHESSWLNHVKPPEHLSNFWWFNRHAFSVSYSKPPTKPPAGQNQWEISRILKWRYCTIFLAIFWGYISLHRPYIGLIYGRYLHFRILKFPLRIPIGMEFWCLPSFSGAFFSMQQTTGYCM